MGLLVHNKYKRDEQHALGSKFLISNGYMGYRGTLDEGDSSDFVALNLNGLFDGETIKESVNAYNPLYTLIIADGINLNPKSFRPKIHEMTLDTNSGVLRRRTDFEYSDIEISVKSERFVDQTDKNLIYSKFMFKVDSEVKIEMHMGIDDQIWNVAENHLVDKVIDKSEDSYFISAKTKHHKDSVHVGLLTEKSFEMKDSHPTKIMSVFRATLEPDKVYTIYKYAGVIHSKENGKEILLKQLEEAKKIGYKKLYKKNEEFWEKIYEIARVEVFNNDIVSDQIDYAVYQLIANRPYSDTVSMSKSGLSGQFKNGAVSWRTEILLLPFYINIDPISARYMVMYRVKGLEEAKKKAKQMGYEGAFYPNRSGIKGYELDQYNLENKIHINGSIIYGIYQYVERTADYSVLFEGALEMLLECARFYLSYATLSGNKKHYNILDVIGLDEVHTKINNEAYTNYMIKNSLDALIKCVAFAKLTDKSEVKRVFDEHNYEDLIDEIRELRRKLYFKKENIEYLIESFDKYFNLEDRNVSTGKKVMFLKKTKIKDPEETSYQRNANVLALQALFPHDYASHINKANYDYYMRRSINPDYFTKVMYIINACENEYPEDGYDMFQELANLDLNNRNLFKEGLNLGLLGGIYLAIIYGFAGLKHHTYLVQADFNSSKKIRRIEFRVRVADNIANVKIKRNSVSVTWGDYNEEDSGDL